jgi:hypothetical protein
MEVVENKSTDEPLEEKSQNIIFKTIDNQDNR